MSLYTRTTRICSVSQLDPALSQPIRDYFQSRQLGDVEAVTLACCQTVSEKQASGKLGQLLDGNPDANSRLAILLTPDWLVWARKGDTSGIVVNGARLAVIKVQAFTARRTNYMELQVSGFMNASKEFVRGNLELGPDLDARKFCEQVVQAVTKMKPPPRKKFFGLVSD